MCGMGDVVDEVDLSLGARDRLRQPRGEDPEVARRLGEGETELGHPAHREPRPHGGEPAAAPPTWSASALSPAR